MSLVVVLLAAVVLPGQEPDGRRPPPPPPPTPMRATAVPPLRPPVIDGRDPDQVWHNAAPVTAFREWQPIEDGEPRFRTVAKLAYDDRNLYAFVRAYDPHPDSILRPLSRRDTFGPS